MRSKKKASEAKAATNKVAAPKKPSVRTKARPKTVKKKTSVAK